MKAIVCDRCKKVFKAKETKLIRINQKVDIDSFSASQTETYEICEECYGYMFIDVK